MKITCIFGPSMILYTLCPQTAIIDSLNYFVVRFDLKKLFCYRKKFFCHIK
jgi:hypothetical protein